MLPAVHYGRAADFDEEVKPAEFAMHNTAAPNEAAMPSVMPSNRS